MPPSFGKTLRANSRWAAGDGPPGSARPSAPASGRRSEREPTPLRPANPPSAPRWLLGPPGGARAAGPTRPPAPPPPRPPAPRSRAPDPAAGREALLGTGARPARAASRPSPPPERAPRRPRRSVISQGPHSPRGSPRLSPASDAKPSPQSQRSAAAARLPSSPGTQTAAPHLRPRDRTRPAAPPRSPPRALAVPRSATGLGWRPGAGGSRRKTGLGALRVTRAHPFPEETPAGRGPRGGGSKCGGPVAAQCWPHPAGEGSPPPAVTRSPPAGPPRAPVRCNAEILTRGRQLTCRGGTGKRSPSSPETLCPRRRRRLCFPRI